MATKYLLQSLWRVTEMLGDEKWAEGWLGAGLSYIWFS
jgi:hypothetical protein